MPRRLLLGRPRCPAQYPPPARRGVERGSREATFSSNFVTRRCSSPSLAKLEQTESRRSLTEAGRSGVAAPARRWFDLEIVGGITGQRYQLASGPRAQLPVDRSAKQAL